MKKSLLRGAAIVTSLAFIIINGCTDYGTAHGMPWGTYQYTGYDERGNVIDNGWLSLIINDSNEITGEWRLEKTGSGNLVGSIIEGRVVLNFHPDYVDHNLLLNGIVEGRTYRGEWSWIGFPGIIDQGPFEAYKR